ncbi:MAG: ornithine--oxo-acid transaminase, partial [Gammaproteobacteria bacterium]
MRVPDKQSRAGTCRVALIGAASDLGAGSPGSQHGPDILLRFGRRMGLPDVASGIGWQAMLSPTGNCESPSEALAAYCQELATAVQHHYRRGRRIGVLGGDHACAIGTWAGVRKAMGPQSRLGLIWFDAHMDAHVPQTSPSGNLHGMPLAVILGHGDGALTALHESGARLDGNNVCVIGVRSFEPVEATLLRRLGVRVFPMREIRCRGLDAVMRAALVLASRGTDGFGVSIDLDVLDPRDAPGVGSPVADGLRGRELLPVLKTLGEDPRLVGAELMEFNPRHDRGQKTARLAWQLLDALFSSGVFAMNATDLEKRFCANNYHPLPVVLIRGEGVYVWDQDGNRYMDMMSAYSSVSHGHGHPRLVNALTEQANRLSVVSRAFYTDRLGPFLQLACELTGQDAALPMNTGAEAVETAIKAARKWGYTVKRVPEGKAEIIVCNGNFHGRTTSIVGFSSEDQYRDGFGPFTPGFVSIPFADADALRAAINENTVAFLVEPVQGEAGIIVPPEGYLSQCARICHESEVLLICDEVQTGLGRTGRLLASQHEGVTPDGLILGKALGGGLLPVSLFLARRQVMDVFSPGDHGSTFGGNPRACAVGREARRVLVDERLSERSAELGDYLMERLAAVRTSLVTDIRGLGLFIGMEIDPARTTARMVCESLMRHGILSKETHDTVVRFAPPLVITRA